jgi:ATP-binding cassette subfamily F protein 3
MIPILDGEITWGHQVELGYYAQDVLQSLNLKNTVLENIMEAAPKMIEREARQLLGSMLFRRDAVFKQAGVLSGGEKSRLALSCLLATGPNVLLLDEPTNHLDLLSTQVLANALDFYAGTVLFVSHNRTFINQVATHCLGLSAKGEALLVEGQLEDFNYMAEKVGFWTAPGA